MEDLRRMYQNQYQNALDRFNLAVSPIDIDIAIVDMENAEKKLNILEKYSGEE